MRGNEDGGVRVLNPTEMMFLLLGVVIFVGGKKLPELEAALGKESANSRRPLAEAIRKKSKSRSMKPKPNPEGQSPVSLPVSNLRGAFRCGYQGVKYVWNRF